jgi:hypothetical protein
MAGALFYGRMAMAGQWKRFSDNPEKVIELRRMCCVDLTPKNAESFFISKTLKMLKKDWRADGIVVAYSDLEHGHTGVIYKASNFNFLGFRKGSKIIITPTKRYHDKSIRNKYKGNIKPFADNIKKSLANGTAFYKTTSGKNTFVFNLGGYYKNQN